MMEREVYSINGQYHAVCVPGSFIDHCSGGRLPERVEFTTEDHHSLSTNK